ncbi:DUF4397 domain-containing protein [Actinokineospora spheciospongiae]|uniref:DUF4397 domain-containing protein n=1 Tax=Actinokineospora spheciospongiae TaxID=909613 RepID=UPI000D715925|nr:DUF4397 domain-containing protein [Actinokineospora spheciospongiae]PWW62584.1 uncharacterized protein DUF4397 [Actinokineospora spheciospongiae]
MSRRTAPLVAAVLLLACAPPAARAAPGPDLGWVRLGHLAPGAPPVDIYLAAFGRAEQVVVRKAGYGAVTPYSALRAGAYTVAMRPADAAPTSPPALTATVDITAATAHSLLVFATGPGGSLRGDLVTDDLGAPEPGTGRVRVVQGTAALAPVTVEVGGTSTPLVVDASYGMTTPYRDLPQGRHDVVLSGSTGRAPTQVDVRAGTSTTLLVTESDGALKSTPLTDSAGPEVKPLLGVETGAGRTSTVDSPVWVLVVLSLLAAAGAGAALRFRTRARG